MMFGVYAIRDVKSGFAGLTLGTDDAVAERNFCYSVQEADFMTSFASDFSLYKVGEFDSDKGTLIPSVPIVHLCDAVSFVPASKQNFFDRSVQKSDG